MPDKSEIVVLYESNGIHYEILLNTLELQEIKKVITNIFERKQTNVMVSDEELKIIRKDGSEWKSRL